MKFEISLKSPAFTMISENRKVQLCLHYALNGVNNIFTHNVAMNLDEETWLISIKKLSEAMLGGAFGQCVWNYPIELFASNEKLSEFYHEYYRDCENLPMNASKEVRI